MSGLGDRCRARLRRYHRLKPLLALAPVRDLRPPIKTPKRVRLPPFDWTDEATGRCVDMESPIIQQADGDRHDGAFYVHWHTRSRPA